MQPACRKIPWLLRSLVEAGLAIALVSIVKSLDGADTSALVEPARVSEKLPTSLT